MTRKEFLHATPAEINTRAKLRRKRIEDEYKSRWQMIEYQSWLTGYYTLAAIGTSFNKHGRYPENPLELRSKSIESIAEKVGKTPEQMNNELLFMSLRINEANNKISRRKEELALASK